jgi:hypothetical protein
MVPRGAKVFIDANAIAGAYATGCLKAVSKAYKLESAAFCIEEATRRDWNGDKLVNVNQDELKKFIIAIPVLPDEIDKLDFLIEGATDVHDGEKALLTLALAAKDPVWWLCGPDRGTLRAMHRLHKHHHKCSMDQMCSLETLTRGIGLKKEFNGEFFNLSEKWLQQTRTVILLT